MTVERGTRGFTLIELLVVVAIIGILAAISLPKLFGALCTSKVGQVDGVFGSINGALSLYYSEAKDFPVYTTANGINVSTYIVSQYMATTPTSPWSGPYYYNGDGSGYTICVAVDGGRGCDGTSSAGTDNYRFYSSNSGRVGQASANPC